MQDLKLDYRLYEHTKQASDNEMKPPETCRCIRGFLALLFDVFLLTLLVLTCWKAADVFRPSPRTVHSKVEPAFDLHPLTSTPLSEDKIAQMLSQIPYVTEVNCSLFYAPPNQWNQTLEEVSEVVPEAELIPQSYTDCSILMSSWVDIQVSEFERRHPIAFSIMVYTNLNRLARLLRAIYRSSNVYCVHVDQKASLEFKAALSHMASCLNNVFLTTESLSVEWGMDTVLKQEMICLEELWKQKLPWQWVINLTGEEFPLKTNLELVHILTIMRGFNDIFVDPCTLHAPNQTWSGCREASPTRFQDRWEESPAPPHFVQPFKGQVHAVLPRATVDFVLHSKVAEEIYNWSLTTSISDEIFFSTLNYNVHLSVPGSNAEYPLRGKRSLSRLKLWKLHRASWPYCHTYLRLVCLLSPRELPMMTSSRQLFANKFKPGHKPVGYACMEEWYFTKVVRELQTGRVQLDLRPYHKLYYQYIGV